MKIRITLKDTGYAFVIDSKEVETTNLSGDTYACIQLTKDDVDMMNFWLKGNNE